MTLYVRSLRFLAMTSFLRFLAKNSDARYTKSPRIKGTGRPRFLAEIPRALHKLFLNRGEETQADSHKEG